MPAAGAASHTQQHRAPSSLFLKPTESCVVSVYMLLCFHRVHTFPIIRFLFGFWLLRLGLLECCDTETRLVILEQLSVLKMLSPPLGCESF